MSLSFAGISLGTWYHRSNLSPSGTVNKDITFANATGRTYLSLGTRPNQPASITFSESGNKRNRLVSGSITTINARIESMNSAHANNTVGTLTYTDGGGIVQTETNMRIAALTWIGSPEQKPPTNNYHQIFTVRFEKAIE